MRLDHRARAVPRSAPELLHQILSQWVKALRNNAGPERSRSRQKLIWKLAMTECVLTPRNAAVRFGPPPGKAGG